jgi:hypothetical protein
MIAGFLRHARTVEHAKALRLHATAHTRRWWKKNWGFREAETKLLKDGRCVHDSVVAPRHYEYEERFGVARTYRMTRIL